MMTLAEILKDSNYKLTPEKAIRATFGNCKTGGCDHYRTG